MSKQSFTVGQVLTAAQLTSLQQTAMSGGAAQAKTASYTLVAADAGTAISMTSTSATTVTVNTGLFAAGDTVFIQNLGSGVSTITAGTATINTSASLALAQYEGGTLYFTSASASLFFKAAGASAAAGGLTLISEQVAAANSGIDFTSISGSFKQLLLVWSGAQHSTTGSAFTIRLNADSGSNYAMTGAFAAATAITAGGANNTSIFVGGSDYFAFGQDANSSALYAPVKGTLLIDNYSSSTKLKTLSGAWSYFDNGGGVARAMTQISGVYNSATAITQLNIVRTAGSATLTNIANTSIRLYGVS